MLTITNVSPAVTHAMPMSSRFNSIGFVCALVSTIVGVWQSVYLKMLMRMGMEKNFVRVFLTHLIGCSSIGATDPSVGSFCSQWSLLGSTKWGPIGILMSGTSC